MSLKSWWQNLFKKPERLRPPAPARKPSRPYDDIVEGTERDQHLPPIRSTTPIRDGQHRVEAMARDPHFNRFRSPVPERTSSRPYDDTVDRLRRDREELAADKDRLRRDREVAWGGVGYGIGDDLYHGDNVVDVTGEGHHHHHHHHEEPQVVVIEEHHHGYDQQDDYASHLREDREADLIAAEVDREPVIDITQGSGGYDEPQGYVDSAPQQETSSYEPPPAQESYSSTDTSDNTPSNNDW